MTDREKQIKFMELFEPCRESLVRFSRAMCRNSETTKDLVQETTLRVYDKFETIKNPAAFKSFLFTTASRIYKRQIWRSRIFFKFNDDEDYYNEFESLVSSEPGSDSNYDIEALHKALQKLSEKYRESVVLFEIIGLSLKEIAEIQGVTLSGVKSRVQRARKELAGLLGVNHEIKEMETETEFSYRYNGNKTDRVYSSKKSASLLGADISRKFEVING